MPKVSVIVATYRREDELKRALFSLGEQTHDNIEIIVVDDNACEKFNSKVTEIVNGFIKQNPDCPIKHIINATNKGSAETRNIGIREAEGKYITFLDDDDVYLPEKVKKQVEFMENGEFDYSVTDLVLYNENDKIVRKRLRTFIRDTSSQALFKYHFKYHITGTDAMMFTKAYIDKINGFPLIDVGDEFYLMQRAIEGAGKFGYLPGCDIKAYVHSFGGGLSTGGGKVDGENNLYEFKKSYFKDLDSKTIRYIKMRHFAVLALSYLKSKKYAEFVKSMLKAIILAPIGMLRIVIKREF